MSKEWIELMSVTAQVFPSGHTLTRDDTDLIDDRGHWYCSEGTDFDGVVEDGKLRASLTVFEFDFVATRSYARHIWDEFGYVEYEYVNNGDLVSEALGDLAAIANALLVQCEVTCNRSVRFLVAWHCALDPGGWCGDTFYEPENSATLLGWANLTKGGIAIVPVEELAQMEPPTKVAKPTKAYSEELPF